MQTVSWLSIKSERKSVRVENNVLRILLPSTRRHCSFLSTGRVVMMWKRCLKNGGSLMVNNKRGKEIKIYRKKTVTRASYTSSVLYAYIQVFDQRFFPNCIL